MCDLMGGEKELETRRPVFGTGEVEPENPKDDEAENEQPKKDS